MKPIGTITMYFPFIDDETISILKDTMHDATDYGDFVRKLAAHVCENDTSDSAVFFAVHHATLLFDHKCLDRIAKIYGKLEIIRPNLFFGNALQGRNEDWEKAKQAAESVLNSDPDEWLFLEMMLLKLEAGIQNYPRSVYDAATLETLKDLLVENPKFSFYESRLYDGLAALSRRDGNLDEALLYTEKAIANARQHDDLNRLAHTLRTKAGMMQFTEREQSQDLLQQSRGLMESMGDKGGLSDVLFELSKLAAIRGEYSKAIKLNLDCVRVRESIGVPTGLSALTLSTLYNMTNDSHAGLEWALMAEDQLLPSLKPRAILNQAWSLSIQSKLTEALVTIDRAREPILKSGQESNIAWLSFVSGVFDIYDGNLSSAAESIEDAIEIYERRVGLMSLLICSYHRALIEVLSEEAPGASTPSDAGPWLSLFQEKVEAENLPGMLGQLLLLQARIEFAKGNVAQAGFNIEESKSIADRLGLEYLQRQVSQLRRVFSKDEDSS
ncbi:MAG: tetratricopeptide repeat protein [Candidatus Thorarchaeota archaeon]